MELQCVIGNHVTLEKPWKYLEKTAIENQIKLLQTDCEFWNFKESIENFPKSAILIGCIPDDIENCDTFYVCLSPESEIQLEEIIQKHEKERVSTLENTIFKKPKLWTSSGSEKIVESLQITSSRSRYLIDVESKYPLMCEKSPKFSQRKVSDVADGYVQFAPQQDISLLVTSRVLIDSTVQSSPEINTVSTNTIKEFTKNQAVQYDYADLIKEVITHDKVNESITGIVNTLDDQIYVASHINFYRDDYKDLLKNDKSSTAEIIKFKEFASMYDTNYSINKEISAIDFTENGIIAIAYSNDAPTSITEDDSHAILIWSLTDTLNSKLNLQSPREVSFLSFNLFDHNFLIGGCLNGQVILWDLTNKLLQTNSEEVLTSNQQKYRNFISSMMNWMKNGTNPSTTPYSMISSTKNSHTDVITDMKWFDLAINYTEKGHVNESKKPRVQLMTCSLDGHVIIWDVSIKSTGLKILYKISIRTCLEDPLLALTSLLILDQNFIALGTLEGDFLTINWNGTDCNVETCQIKTKSQFHDGPIVTTIKSSLNRELILTVGGKVFAIWSEKLLGKPIFWRRNPYHYTYGVWSENCPSMFRLTRSDGCIEIWKLSSDTTKPIHVEEIAGRSISHPLILKENIMGIAISKGYFRLFNDYTTFKPDVEEETYWMKTWIDKEVERKLNFEKWYMERRRKRTSKIEIPNVLHLLQKQEKKVESGKIIALPKEREKELKRIQTVLLRQRMVDTELLQRQTAPLKQLQQDEIRRQRKVEERLSNSEQIFNEAKNRYFSSGLEEEYEIPLNPYQEVVLEPRKVLSLMMAYKKIEGSCQDVVKISYKDHYSWAKLMSHSKSRRTFQEGFCNISNQRHKLKNKKYSPTIVQSSTLENWFTCTK